MDLLLKIGRADTEKAKTVRAAKDAQGGESKLWLTSDVKEDIYNAFAHGHRLVDPIERMMRDEVYLYHYKMMVKEPRVGGAWEWHQDYGYWYNNECLYPDMASCMIAVDRAEKATAACKSSAVHTSLAASSTVSMAHRPAPIRNASNGAATARTGVLRDGPGTALFFHANVLHRSDQNPVRNRAGH